MVFLRQLLVAAVVVLVILMPGRCAHADPPANRPADLLVKKLSHPSYQTRSRARRDLLSRGPTVEVRGALAAGLKSESLEVRQHAHEILQQFDFASFNEQLDRLTNLAVPADEIRLTGWQQFSTFADSSPSSRRLYGRIALQHSGVIEQLDRDGSRSAAVQRFIAGADPYRLPPQDAVRWALLLYCDSLEIDLGRPDLSPRILDSLTQSGLGPTQTATGDRQVLQQLIEHWVAVHPSVGTVRSQLVVAMRYQCDSLSRKLADQTLADPSAAASAQATAMLCATVLGYDDLTARLRQRLEDGRTAHEWQLIPSRKTKIRTQVRDVALAVLLHRQGIDPRQVGFVELQADPLMLYRDHSLGFADDDQRAAAHAEGRRRLGL
jgi:hypothetical protein